MQKVSILCVGKLKEKFYRDAVEEYSKRLQRFCKLEITELPETRLPEDPSPAQVRQALADAKLEFDPALISELGPALSHMRPSDVGLELFSYPAMNRLLHLPCPPTAVLLLWDELAPGAIAAIRDTRREVPRDVSLVGFNDDELCTLITPHLSTVRQDGEAMGEAAVRLLAERINRNTPIPPRTLVPSRFINRDTTASLTK